MVQTSRTKVRQMKHPSRMTTIFLEKCSLTGWFLFKLSFRSGFVATQKFLFTSKTINGGVVYGSKSIKKKLRAWCIHTPQGFDTLIIAFLTRDESIITLGDSFAAFLRICSIERLERCFYC